jgi:hypothetical protein
VVPYPFADGHEARGTFLAAKSFTDNQLIDGCVQRGCAMDFKVTWLGDKAGTLEWAYRGKVSSIEVALYIDSIKIVREEGTLTVSNSKIAITSLSGKHHLTLFREW